VNKRDWDILYELASGQFNRQRDLAGVCGCSLGAVNASIKKLSDEGYIDRDNRPSSKTQKALRDRQPERAVILCDSRGVSIPPNNTEWPKALLETKGETLIERIIRHLHEVGITEIRVIVGFAKERFEFLIDRYNVELVVNPDYISKGSLHALALTGAHLNNCYVVPGDVWFSRNPFRHTELYSWYMVSDTEEPDSFVRVNRKQELATVPVESPGNAMMSLCYLCGKEADCVSARLAEMDADYRRKHDAWEEALISGDKITLLPRMISFRDAARISSFEDMQEIGSPFSLLSFDPAPEIARLMNIPVQEISGITLLKKGTTNHSYRFTFRGSRYILRQPRDGAEQMINHLNETNVYRALGGQGIAEEYICFEADTGLKISKYIENMRPCDPYSQQDASLCMKKLRHFHEANLVVDHTFDLYKMIDHFESLWTAPSVYEDYAETKRNVLSLREYVVRVEKDWCLTHIDPVPDNFLIPADESDPQDVRLIDWEYAGMQDPHVDIAMFCLYAMYNRTQVDWLIDAYFTEGCRREIRLKIYCYIAIGGLIWSNWCEYKYKTGTYFGEYSLKQYRYAKEYYRIVQNELIAEKEDTHAFCR